MSGIITNGYSTKNDVCLRLRFSSPTILYMCVCTVSYSTTPPLMETPVDFLCGVYFDLLWILSVFRRRRNPIQRHDPHPCIERFAHIKASSRPQRPRQSLNPVRQFRFEKEEEERKKKMRLALQSLSLTFLVTYSALKWLKYYRFPKNFPPGPPCMPFLGVLPFVKVGTF